jgi:hypothetical protein
MKEKIQNIINIAHDMSIEIDPVPIVTGTTDIIQKWIKLASKLGTLYHSPTITSLTCQEILN